MDIRKSGTNLKLALTGETYDDTYIWCIRKISLVHELLIIWH